MHKYICYFCDKEFKEIAYYSIHMEKNLCTFISNTSSSDVEIQSYLYKLNKEVIHFDMPKKRNLSSISCQ